MGIGLAPGHELRHARHTSGHALVYPSGIVQLNASAAAILALCDGKRTREDIVAAILESSSDTGSAALVCEFLDAARHRHWIVEQ